MILFRNSEDVCEEFKALKASQVPYILYRSDAPEGSVVVGRYSVLPFYKELAEELDTRGSRLINTYEQHLYLADVGQWYPDLVEYTPETWFEWYSLPEQAYVVKGRTNSRKFQWNRQMFCQTKGDVQHVVASLLDDTFIREQGLCVRKYIPLMQYDKGINGLPITNEWRVFCIGTLPPVAYDYYWSNYSECKPYSTGQLPAEFHELVKRVQRIVAKKAEFYVIDVAETAEGEWVVIELNDGQMSGLSMIDPASFYSKLGTYMSGYQDSP